MRRALLVVAAALVLAAPASAAEQRACFAFAEDIGSAIIHGWQISADGVSCAQARAVIVGGGSVAGDQEDWRWHGWRFHTKAGADWTRTVLATTPGKRIAFKLTIISF